VVAGLTGDQTTALGFSPSRAGHPRALANAAGAETDGVGEPKDDPVQQVFIDPTPTREDRAAAVAVSAT